MAEKPTLGPVPFSRPIIDPIAWEGETIPLREWIVPDMLPAKVVTMMSGDGGLGKSTIALQLAVACATGGQWIGRPVKPCKVLVVACEDDRDELHRRLYDILQNSAPLGFGDLENLRIVEGAGHDNVLVNFDDSDRGKRTDFLEFIEEESKDCGLVILDSLHDFFAGNENARPQARQFINQLRRIAMLINGSVLLLAHPSQAGLSSKSGNAGSTAWNNTVRSRLYLTREEESGPLVLKTMKANYAPNGGRIRVEYRGGMFHSLDDKPQHAYEQIHIEDVFLQCLKACTDAGRRVSDSVNGSYAPKVFSTMESINRGYRKDEFTRCMARMFDMGLIRLGPVTDASRNTRVGIVAVPKPKQEAFEEV